MTAKKSIIYSQNSLQQSRNDGKKSLPDFALRKSTKACGNLIFNVPESMAKKLDKLTDEKVTRISVEKKNGGTQEISSDELKSYLQNNKKINKITIEEVKVNDLKRMNLHFDKKNEGAHNPVSIESLSMISFEKKINQSFLDRRRKSNLKNEFEELATILRKSESDKNEPSLNDEFNNLKMFVDKAKKFTKTDIIDTEKKVKLEDDMLRPFVNLSMSDNDDVNKINAEEVIEKNVELNISKHEFKRNNSKSLSKLYYRAVNHLELFKLGDSYLQDFNRGIKNIAFNSINSSSEKEKTVLGVSSFLNYNARVTVTVVTDSFHNSLYHKLIPDLEEVQKPLFYKGLSFTCYAINGIEIVDYSELWNIINQIEDAELEEFIESFSESSDVILWDLPLVNLMDDKKELFYPIIRFLDNVSLIVKSNVSKYKDLDSIKDYFEKYQVPIKGLVLAD